MGYYIRFLPKKRKAPNWKVQYISHKKEHVRKSNAKNPGRTWDIPRERWSELGFRSYMSIEQARGRQRQLNAQLALKRLEERRKKIQEDKALFEKKCQGFLPEIYKEEFENKYIWGRPWQKIKRNKSLSHWLAAQRLILDVQLEPSDWYDEAQRFYDHFYQRRFSFSYIRKILGILNLWGFFLARKLGKPFFSISVPRGYEKSRLLEAYFEKTSGRGNQSDPLTPSQLEKVKGQMKEDQYNWLYLSVWLGLRPQEVDQLKEKNQVRELRALDGTPILWVNQTKLVSVPPRYRWKLIPLFLEEQKEALKIMKTGNFKRPLCKTVKHYFGPHTTLYGGRKGFTDLMLGREQSFENISQWMGHSSLERTWKHYKSKRNVHFKVVS